MYKDYYEVHEADWQAMQDYLAFEEDMASMPYGNILPSSEDIEAMAAEMGLL